MNFKRFLQAAFLVAGLFFTVPLLAQTINPQDLSKIRVDELSETQIRQFVAQMQSIGVTGSRLDQVALTRGMRPEEVRKLRERVNKLNQGSSLRRPGVSAAGLEISTDSLKLGSDTLTLVEQALEQLRSRIFGADLFSKTSSTFEPNLRLATPVNYQIGPDDELLIDIYGYSEASYNLKVSPEGSINIPYVGVVQVGGMTIEQATARIKSRLSTIYTGLRSGNTNVRIAIGNIRSIKVILTGELVRPGTYTLPSVASVFNALFQSGGPTENGSFRQIEIIRGARKIATLDVYDFLLTGQLKNNIRLQDNDVIRVPTYRKRVEIVGEVKRPGIFEMVEGENLGDLLRFAGDFTERAYQARIKVLKNTPSERKITDIVTSEFTSYKPATGDKFFVNEILDRFQNRVSIEGAVFRPGSFELEAGLTVSKLIEKAEGLREDAFRNRGYISRLTADLQPELISFDLARILTGNAVDIPLKREDIVVISSIFDLKEEYHIQVEGEVQQPGKLGYAEGMTLEDALLQAGGFKESATGKRVEVSRRVKNSNALSASAQTAEVFQMNVNPDLKSGANSFVLQPFDIIAVRPSPGYEVQRVVKIEGEVLYPGIYTLVKKDERISDLIRRAGGFSAWAYAEGASLRRTGPIKDSVALRKEFEKYLVKQIKQNKSNGAGGKSIINSTVDTITVNPNSGIANRNEFVGINLPHIMKQPGTKEDIFLEEGDVLYVPKQLQTVKVSGEVLSPVTVVYSRGKGFKQYVANAGGFNDKAKRKRSYIRYANGAVKSSKSFLLFNTYPRVKPGAEIIVPLGPPKRPISLTELIGISSSLISLYLLINSLK